MTSIPASRSARAIIFAPRSWPSSPGLAISTLIFFSTMGRLRDFSVFSVDLCGLCGGLFLFLLNISPNPILENGNVKINEKAGHVVGQLKVSENHCFVYSGDLLNGLQFDHYLLFHQ